MLWICGIRCEMSVYPWIWLVEPSQVFSSGQGSKLTSSVHVEANWIQPADFPLDIPLTEKKYRYFSLWYTTYIHWLCLWSCFKYALLLLLVQVNEGRTWLYTHCNTIFYSIILVFFNRYLFWLNWQSWFLLSWES